MKPYLKNQTHTDTLIDQMPIADAKKCKLSRLSAIVTSIESRLQSGTHQGQSTTNHGASSTIFQNLKTALMVLGFLLGLGLVGAMDHDTERLSVENQLYPIETEYRLATGF